MKHKKKRNPIKVRNKTQISEDSCHNKEKNSEEESSYQDNEEDKEKENCNQIEVHNVEKKISN
jgi:hypothetical protein